MKMPSFIRRPSSSMAMAIALALVSGSGTLLWMHASAVRDMREIGLPAAVSLPIIEKRMEILREQNDIAELQATLRGGAHEELLRMYIIPESEEIDRLLAGIDVFVSYMEKKRMLSGFSKVDIGDMRTQSGITVIPVSFEADMTAEGLSTFSHFIDISGLLTVSDTLSPEEIDALLALSEQDQPSTIAALEHFLSTDLLRYSVDSDAYDMQLKKSFLASSEGHISSILGASRLREVKVLLSEIAPVLRAQNLWPLRLVTVEEASYASMLDGRVHAAFTLNAYVRQR